MTPAARLSAAIVLLDNILAGEPAERALTRWARGNRYAGSKDRAAVRDTVFDVIRRRRSLGNFAGAESGRALVLASQVLASENLDLLFTGEGFAPEILSDEERNRLGEKSAPSPVILDFPDFLLPELTRSLGADLAGIMAAMQERAPVDLRVNRLKATRTEAERMLARDLIFTEPHPLSPYALRIVENPRKLARSLAYDYGLVELQDVSSQVIARFAGAIAGMTVLDYCAGGGGKTLALAGEMAGRGRLIAHDANVGRMKDLPTRAGRAGAEVEIMNSAQLERAAPDCDLVLVDAPCTGSGAWRRNPDSKWLITPEIIENITSLQARILEHAGRYVKPGGTLVYATCSLLNCENDDQVAGFLDRFPNWSLEKDIHLTPLTSGDGFYGARLVKPSLHL